MTRITAQRAIRRGLKAPADLPFDTFQKGDLAPLDEAMIAASMKNFPDFTREAIVAQLEDVRQDTIFITAAIR
jgi:hypothetical protein